MSTVEHRIAALKAVELFAGASEADLRALAQGVQLREYAAGQVLVEAGKPGNEVFILDSGECEVRKDSSRGPLLLAVLGAGDFFGEMALLIAEPRSATVAARTPTRAFVLSGWAFREAIQLQPHLGFQIMRSLATRLRDVEGKLAAVRSTEPAPVRPPPAAPVAKRAPAAAKPKSKAGGSRPSAGSRGKKGR